MNPNRCLVLRRSSPATRLLLVASLHFLLTTADPASCGFTARAASTDGPAATADTAQLTLGLREMAPPIDRKFTLEGGYTAEVLGVVSGGVQRGAVYRGLMDGAIQCDLAAIAGAPADSVFRVSALFPHGGTLSDARIGDLQGASNIEAYNHPLLYELWFGGSLGRDRLAWRAGRLVADGDFATTESGGVFLNSSFGWPAFISANTLNTGPAFYRSALGVFGRLALAERLHARAGVYDGDTFDDAGGDPSRHPDGFNFRLSRGQGAFAVVEVVLEREADSTSRLPPGTLKLGAWHHTAEFSDQLDPTRGHRGNHGWYAVVEQALWREPGEDPGGSQGLTVFARTGFTPRDRNFIRQAWDAGLSYTGLVPGRDADTLGLGVAAVRISEDYRRAERAAGHEAMSDYELVVEISYRLVGGENWSLMPDLQWIRHPGGSPALPDALLLGLRTRVTF